MRFGLGFRALQLSSGFQLLPPREAYIVNTTAEYNAATDVANPPDSASIYNSWGRFAGNSWYPQGVGATGEATSWSYSNGSILSTVNSSNYIGFISPEALSHYQLATDVSSTGSDDDLISVVVAFRYVGGEVRTLSLFRANGGLPASRSWGLLETTGNTHTMLANGTPNAGPYYQNADGGNGWAQSGITRIFVLRTGNVIEAHTSYFGTTDSVPSTYLRYEIPSGSIFEGECEYGFGCWSQQSATFSISSFSGGLDANTVYDVRSTPYRVMRFQNGAWVHDTGTNIHTDLGFPRVITNPTTGKSYFSNGSTISQM